MDGDRRLSRKAPVKEDLLFVELVDRWLAESDDTVVKDSFELRVLLEDQENEGMRNRLSMFSDVPVPALR